MHVEEVALKNINRRAAGLVPRWVAVIINALMVRILQCRLVLDDL